MRRCLKTAVAPSTPSPFCNNVALVVLRNFTEKRVPVLTVYNRAKGYMDRDISAIPACLMFTVLRPVHTLVSEVHEAREAFFSGYDYIPSFAPVSAVRPASWDKFLPSEAYTTVTAFAGPNIDLCFINKFHSTG